MNEALKTWIEISNLWMTAVFASLFYVIILLTGFFILLTVFVVWVTMAVIAFPVFVWKIIKKPLQL